MQGLCPKPSIFHFTLWGPKFLAFGFAADMEFILTCCIEFWFSFTGWCGQAPKVELPPVKAPKKAAAKSGEKKERLVEDEKEAPLDPIEEKLRQQRYF